MTIPQDLIKRDLKITNVDKYHERGYKGKNFVVFNTEDGTTDADHMKMTNSVLSRVTPEVTIINGRISSTTIQGQTQVYAIINGEKFDLKEVIKRYSIKVMTTSKAGTSSEGTLKYLKEVQQELGTICICAGGNDGDTGLYTKDSTAIAVAAVYVYEDGTAKRLAYSTIHEELDFSAPLGGGQGTSAAAPFLAGEILLLLERYGDFTHDESIEILKSICINLGEKSSYGYGLPVLPLGDKLEILEKLRGEKMSNFKDIEETRWSKAAIDRCVTEGILVGFEDGTFRPTENVTREQFATILTRILDKVEGRQ